MYPISTDFVPAHQSLPLPGLSYAQAETCSPAESIPVRQQVTQAFSLHQVTGCPIDLLVNNAGAFRAFGWIADIDPQEWWREVVINVRGLFLYTHAVLLKMIECCRGWMINVASGAGLHPFETILAYNICKTARIRLTESAVLETRAYGIKVFVISPGTVRTPMNE